MTTRKREKSSRVLGLSYIRQGVGVARRRIAQGLIPVSLFIQIMSWVGPAWSVEEVNVFRAEIPVQSRVEPLSAEYAQRAMTAVLVKITGDVQAGSRPGAKAILEQSNQFLQQYRYIEQTEGDPPYLLWVQFDRTTLEPAVSQAGLPVWSSQRPSVVVWLAVDGPDGRLLVGEDDATGVREAIFGVAQARGVPIVLPLLDLQDQQHVSAADILGEFDHVVRQASQRYGTDALLVGRANGRGEDNWRVRWRLYSGPQPSDWVTEGSSLPEAAASGMQRLADLMAKRMTVRSTMAQTGSVLLRVEGVANLEGFARVDGYLRGLGQVDALAASVIEPTSVTFALTLKGSTTDLERVLSLGEVLERTENPVPVAEHGPVLAYRLRWGGAADGFDVER